MAELVAFREDRLGFRFKIGEKARLGRAADCDLILFDRSASRHHAEITQSDEDYYIEDLNSTNGTLVNDLPITEKITLTPYDCVKIGQEVYIFEPFLDVITGQAPSALIVNATNEPQQNIISKTPQQAASSITPAQSARLISFTHKLCMAQADSFFKVLIDFLESELGATAISILWPGGTGSLRQISLLSHPEDKRLLLSQVPYRRSAELGQSLVWPHIITELFFNAGNRNIEHVYQPCLLTPLYSADDDHMGLIYVENSNRTLEEEDLNLLAAVGLLISPYFKNIALHALIENNRRLSEERSSPSKLLGRDHQIKVIFSTAAHLAQTNTPIFITGEVGTGKTSLARHIHQQSLKKNGRFIEVTLSGLSQSQMEVILFGQEGGDNTVGLFVLADNGTIFLRHIENIPLSTQKSILMCLEEGIIYPVGSRQLGWFPPA
jgi:hypothetical protein